MTTTMKLLTGHDPDCDKAFYSSGVCTCGYEDQQQKRGIHMPRPRIISPDEQHGYESLLHVMTNMDKPPYAFPMGMLAIDNCYPLNTGEAEIIGRSLRVKPSEVEHYSVILVRRHKGKKPSWSTSAWESLGFEIETVTPSQAKALRADEEVRDGGEALGS